MKKIIAVLLVLFVATNVFANATSESSEPAMENDSDWAWATKVGNFVDVDPTLVEGDVAAAGSSTVYPLSQAVINQFVAEGYTGSIALDSIGSGGGFERWAENAESDISNASRGIKDSEVEAARGNGREPIEFRLGTDALTVAVSKENDFVTDVTFAELALIFGSAETWADVRPEWPAEPIQRFIPGTDSGTFDFFVEVVYDEDETDILAASNTQKSEDDNILVNGIVGSPYAVGFFGYSYYQANQDKLTAVAIEGVAPNAATVNADQYPISRPLFMYSAASIIEAKPQVAAFIAYYLTVVNEVIDEVGYFPAPAEVLEASKAKVMEVIGDKF